MIIHVLMLNPFGIPIFQILKWPCFFCISIFIINSILRTKPRRKGRHNKTKNHSARRCAIRAAVQKPRHVAESLMDLAVSAAAKTGAPGLETRKRAAQHEKKSLLLLPETCEGAAQHENKSLLTLHPEATERNQSSTSHALIGAEATAPAHRKTLAIRLGIVIILGSIGILCVSYSVFALAIRHPILNSAVPSASEAVASARYEPLGVEASGSESAAPPPPPRLPISISHPPLPLAAPKCYQHFCEDSNQDCCAPADEAAMCREGLVPVRTNESCYGFAQSKFECCEAECWVCRTLWRTAGASSKQPRALPPADWPAVASVGVVVAYCGGDLSWLTDYAKELATWALVMPTVTIYSKCAKESTARALFNASDFLSPTIISLPNTGRNDHTYAHHMSTHYHSLQDVMIFVKDTYNPNHPQRRDFGELVRDFDHGRAVESVYGELVSLGFACLYSPWQVAPNRLHSAWHSWKNLRGFHLSEYGGNGDFQSAIHPLGPWFDHILNGTVGAVEPPGQLWPVCYGGNFAASRERIQAVPEALWNRIRLALTRAENIEEGHFLERIWAGLLNPRLSPQDEALLLDHRVEPGCEDEWHDDDGGFSQFAYQMRCMDGVLNLCACET